MNGEPPERELVSPRRRQSKRECRPLQNREGWDIHIIQDPNEQSVPVPIHLPAEVANGGFVDGAGSLGEVGRDVVLESVFADVVQ